MESSSYFPQRLLTEAELSLLCKHRHSLLLVKKTTLVLEDDANLNKGSLKQLLSVLKYCSANDVFADIATFDGLSRVGNRINICEDHVAYLSRIGLTRTTGAFIVTPQIASKFLQYYLPVSIPADLHHQYLLCKGMIPGIWPKDSIFVNESGTIQCPSSIQNKNV
jgi:hypothetical protein